MKKCTTLYISIILCMVKCLSCEPVVEIDNIKITGKSVSFGNTIVNQYLGIPYAYPPVEELRFKKPVPIKNYLYDIDASFMPPSCPQYSDKPIAWIPKSPYKSEDCLFLNIWVPSDECSENPKAVLYWMYGGGQRYGSVNLPTYFGLPLAALGDIIVVTVNYRVGPFGFLTSGTQDAPGNVGLWDMLEGLRWVNKYIGKFGGDTSRITIAAQSAGFSVGLFAVSPLARGLYQRQIMQSGSSTHLAAEDNTHNLVLAQKLAQMAGCANSTFTIKDNPGPVVQCLRSVKPDVLAKYDYDLDPISNPTFFYQYGDDILPTNPRISILKGDFKCTELLIGTNHDEASLMLLAKYADIFGSFGEKKTIFNKTTGAYFIRDVFKAFPDRESVVQYYLPESLPEEAGATIRYQTYTSIGDFVTLCPTVYHAEKCAEKGGKVYSYYFTQQSGKSPYAEWIGATHFEEVQYVFGSPLLNPNDYTDVDQWISREMIGIWSSFVKDGKPRIPLNSKAWPLYSKDVPLIKLLGPGIVTGEDGIGSHRDNCDFFRPYITSV